MTLDHEFFGIEPVFDWADCTPHDTNAQPSFVSIFCNIAGDVVIESDGGNESTFAAVSGQILPLAGLAAKIKTSSTATMILLRPNAAPHRSRTIDA